MMRDPEEDLLLLSFVVVLKVGRVKRYGPQGSNGGRGASGYIQQAGAQWM